MPPVLPSLYLCFVLYHRIPPSFPARFRQFPPCWHPDPPYWLLPRLAVLPFPDRLLPRLAALPFPDRLLPHLAVLLFPDRLLPRLAALPFPDRLLHPHGHLRPCLYPLMNLHQPVPCMPSVYRATPVLPFPYRSELSVPLSRQISHKSLTHTKHSPHFRFPTQRQKVSPICSDKSQTIHSDRVLPPGHADASFSSF